MKENNYIVYIHKCPNDKVYIGITCQGIKKRWRNNGEGYKKNKHFYNAIKKYGWNNIEHKILYENLDEKEAYKKEIELIKQYKSNKREKGYNKSTGGKKSSRGVIHTEETKRKWSEAHKGQISHMKGKHHTEETKLKISVACKGNIPPNKGKKTSEEARKKMSDSHKGKKVSEETKHKLSLIFTGKEVSKETRKKISVAKFGKSNLKIAKKVLCIETNRIYNSVEEAKKELNIRHICEACNGKRKTAGGYHWKYI